MAAKKATTKRDEYRLGLRMPRSLQKRLKVAAANRGTTINALVMLGAEMALGATK